MLKNSASFNEKIFCSNFLIKSLNNREENLFDKFGSKGLLVIFMCNHCPYVKSIEQKIKSETDALLEIGFNTVAFMSNDQNTYPDDSNKNLNIQLKRNNFSFSYYLDCNQKIAKFFDIQCTPEFLCFSNENKKLFYHGRLDSNSNKEDMGERELFNAVKKYIHNKEIVKKQFPSMGCSIKWNS